MCLMSYGVFPGRPFQPNLIFANMARAYPGRAPTSGKLRLYPQKLEKA